MSARIGRDDESVNRSGEETHLERIAYQALLLASNSSSATTSTTTSSLTHADDGKQRSPQPTFINDTIHALDILSAGRERIDPSPRPSPSTKK